MRCPRGTQVVIDGSRARSDGTSESWPRRDSRRRRPRPIGLGVLVTLAVAMSLASAPSAASAQAAQASGTCVVLNGKVALTGGPCSGVTAVCHPDGSVSVKTAAGNVLTAPGVVGGFTIVSRDNVTLISTAPCSGGR